MARGGGAARGFIRLARCLGRQSRPRIIPWSFHFDLLHRHRVTALLADDATALVLTPAVLAVIRKARVQALPFVFACAFIANAASFVLPISNLASIVVYADHVPPQVTWLASYALPPMVSIAATLALLWWTPRVALREHCDACVEVPR